MTHNRAIIYSNGIADFHRYFEVRKEQPTEIAIPVRRDHIADVLASLNVYGNVSLSSPPSFRPANETEGTLSIDTDDVIEGLAKSLGGAKVQVERGGSSISGTLVGLHTEPESTGGERITTSFLVIQTDEGLNKIALREVQNLQFDDETVQTEINKSLQRNYQRIKPNSTFVELALDTEESETQAIVQYTIPAAAWKISYRLRQRENEIFEFQGFAIVDNNTDEDWNDFIISVVTGEPITFSTDLADSKTPQRYHVNVVKDATHGAVEVEESQFADMAVDATKTEAVFGLPAAAPTGQISPSVRRKVRRRFTTHDQMLGGLELAESAKTADAEAREVGDFSVFESEAPVSIGSNRSAIIPIFNTTLDQSKVVLHYKFENHAVRPYRSVQFKNESTHSLGRGVCTVFQDGTYVGSCIMPTTKPGGEGLLPHALETGVRLRQERKRQRTKNVGLRLSKGFCYSSSHQTQTTVYHIKNSRDEQFELFFDHDYLLAEPKLECIVSRNDEETPCLPTVSFKNGFRLSISVYPKEELSLKIVESRVHQSSINLVDRRNGTDNVYWLQQNLVATNGPLSDDPSIKQCLEIQQRLDAKQTEMNQAVAEIERLEKRQSRLRENIKTGGHDEQTNRWKTDLGQAEDKLVDLEDKMLPKLRLEETQIAEELRSALLSLAIEWNDSCET